MSEQLDTKTGWLSRDELENARANVPLVYVDAVPVKVDELGRITKVGLPLLSRIHISDLTRLLRISYTVF